MPMYSNPAVSRSIALVLRIDPKLPVCPPTRLGFLVKRQFDEFARWRIIAGWLVVLVYGLPVAR